MKYLGLHNKPKVAVHLEEEGGEGGGGGRRR